MNHMEEIIKILGVKFNEEFYLTKHGDTRFVIVPGGMFSQGENNEWEESSLLYAILLGEYEIKKIPQPILTEEEREYLSYVIKPFRDEIEYIHKFTCPNSTKEYLLGFIKDIGYHLELPPFIKGTMYCGIELGKEYTLEELGL